MEIFVCYSRKDSEVLKDLEPILKRLKDHKNIDYFIDTRNIEIGSEWDKEIQQSIERSTIAIILLSGNLLNSTYATMREIPLLINFRKNIFPLLLRECDYKSVSALKGIGRFQFINEADKPFQSLDKEEKEKLLEKLSERISSLCDENKYKKSDYLIQIFVNQYKNKYNFNDKKEFLKRLIGMANIDNLKYYSEFFSAYLHWYECREDHANKSEDHANKSIETFEGILIEDQNFALAYFGVARVYENEKKIKMGAQALYYYDLAKDLQEELSAYVYLGKANVYRNNFVRKHRKYDYKSKYDYKKAKEYYRKSIKEDGSNPYPLEGLATLYRENELYDQSLECCDDAIRISDNYATPWISSGRAYEEKHTYKEAEKCYKQAHGIDPKWYKPIKCLIDLYERIGDMESAKKYQDILN